MSIPELITWTFTYNVIVKSVWDIDFARERINWFVQVGFEKSRKWKF